LGGETIVEVSLKNGLRGALRGTGFQNSLFREFSNTLVPNLFFAIRPLQRDIIPEVYWAGHE
jgi:hypothetical protein